MRQDVPLAAEELTEIQEQAQERPVVPARTTTNLGEPALETFYRLVFLATAILVESARLSPAERVSASVALAAMIPWYLFFGRRVIARNEADWDRSVRSWRGPAYLAGLLVLFAVADHANPNAWFFAFGFSPQCFQLTTIRRGMSFIVAFNLVAALMGWLDDHTVQNAASGIAIALFAIGFSWVFSRWVARVVEQSHERATLLAQLEAAQAELAAANHEAGVLAERQRLSAEIHDTLAQGFLSIVTLIQATQRSTDPAGPHLDLALATAKENLAEARGLVANLAPASLDDGGLPGAVARAADATAQAAGIEATSEITGTARPLSTTAEVVLLRVTQEALTNVRKHAQAARVDVQLSYTPETVTLSVADNGRGFASDTPAPGSGFGLRGMRERLRQAGGTLTVTSAPGAGTTVRAEIPA